MMPTVALFAWPFVTLGIFAAIGPVRGLIWATVVGYLFLPEQFQIDMLGLPPYEKTSAIVVSLLLAMFIFGRGAEKKVTGDRMLQVVFNGLAITLLVSPVFTIASNMSPAVNGGSVRPALSPRDLVAMTSEIFFALVPFFLARRWLTTPDRHKMLLMAFAIMGLVYSMLVLFEVRMSPQLNRWVYGYFPHSWLQHLRGGYRPIVFLNHGLWVGFFLFTAVAACFALSRHLKREGRLVMLVTGVWVLGALALSRNLGAVILVVLLMPTVLFLTLRMQIWIAAIVAMLFLAYPIARQAELVPIDEITSTIASFAPNRASSFNYRLDQEEDLLARAMEKPVFGWGGWARAQIYNEQGRMVSVADGIWILVLGERGWVGFLTLFGLMCVPLLYLGRAARRKSLTPATAGLAIIAAGNLIYMVPNATLTPLSWLVFGALAGFAQSDVKVSDATAEEVDAAVPERRTRYTRFAPGQGGAKTRTRPAAMPLRR